MKHQLDNTNPAGRLDVLALRVLDRVCSSDPLYATARPTFADAIAAAFRKTGGRRQRARKAAR